MAKRSVGRRGRSVVALLLLGFVLVATSVIWRRAYGVNQARAVQALDVVRVQLEAERAKLESEIRDAGSRRRIQSIAEQRLRLHIPNDSQVIVLERPTVRPDDSR
jgi:cell division protein FtsL